MVTITLKSLEQKRDEISRIEDQTSPNFKECQAKHLEIDVLEHWNFSRKIAFSEVPHQ